MDERTQSTDRGRFSEPELQAAAVRKLTCDHSCPARYISSASYGRDALPDLQPVDSIASEGMDGRAPSDTPLRDDRRSRLIHECELLLHRQSLL